MDHTYWISKYEVTNQQYRHYLNDLLQDSVLTLDSLGCKSKWPGDAVRPAGEYYFKYWTDDFYLEGDSLRITRPEHPVVDVSWFGAKMFCLHYGFDLPTWEEWHKAAVGNRQQDFPWGDQIGPGYANYANSGDPYEPGTCPVGFFNGNNYEGFQTHDNQSPYGAYDMAGNAWEWTRTPWTPEHPFCIGGGGGFLFHYPAQLRAGSVDCLGTPWPQNLDRCFGSDGIRPVWVADAEKGGQDK